MVPVALTIAGSDPSGGAGIQADLKTFHQFGVYGEAVVTLLTVQNTVRLERVECVPAELVLSQLRAVLEDMAPQAAKTGALGNLEIVEAVAEAAAEFAFPLVVDPVMISKHGQRLISPDAIGAIRERLLPRAALICPNLPEAEELAGMPVRTVDDMRTAAQRLCEMGAKAALVKGGHLPGSAIDVLFDGTECREFTTPHIDTPHTHGTGCTYSAAIVAELARGASLHAAVARAKNYITQAIRSSPGAGTRRWSREPPRADRTESGGQMKFADLLNAAIQNSEIPLRFEPGAEEAIARPIIELLQAWLEAHQPAKPTSEFDAGQQALIGQLVDELSGRKDVPSA